MAVQLKDGWSLWGALTLSRTHARDCLCPGLDVKFSVNTFDVRAHGGVADPKHPCDFLVQVSIGKEVEDLRLPS